MSLGDTGVVAGMKDAVDAVVSAGVVVAVAAGKYLLTLVDLIAASTSPRLHHTYLCIDNNFSPIPDQQTTTTPLICNSSSTTVAV